MSRFRAHLGHVARRVWPRSAQNRVGAAVLGVVLLLGAPSAYGQDDDVLSTITDERVAESSALVQSTEDPDLAYTINDSGNETVVYVLELATGDVVGTAALDVDAEDTEAMAIGGDGRLYVADIGDNGADRSRVALYAFAQPGVGDTTVSTEAYEIRYRDGPMDAETLLVDPVTGQMEIVTKDVLAGQVLRLPDPLRPDRVNVARPIPDRTVSGIVTDGAYLPDGRGVLLRTYGDIVVYKLPGWREQESIDTPSQPQSESLAAWRDGHTVLVGTEKLPSTIIEVRIPDEVWEGLQAAPDRAADAEPTPADSPAAANDGSGGDDGGGDDSDGDDSDGGWVVASGAAVVILGAAWLWAHRARRRPRH